MNYGLKDMWNDLKPFWIALITVFAVFAVLAGYVGLQMAINLTTTTVTPTQSVTETQNDIRPYVYADVYADSDYYTYPEG